MQISKAFVYSKNSIFNQKRFFSTFSPPSQAGRLLPPPAQEQSAQVSTTDRPRTAPMVGPDYLHRRENNYRITPSFPH
jgi:hypothetical protein